MLHGEGGEEAATKFADDVLSVFIWVLLAFSAVMMIAMPGIVWLLARDFQTVPGKFEFAVFLSRVTFPYLAFVSLVAMLSGLLNARSRFAPGAFAPVLLNIVLIGGIVTGWWLRGPGGDDRIVAEALCVAVSVAGVVQLAYMWWAVRRAGGARRTAPTCDYWPATASPRCTTDLATRCWRTPRTNGCRSPRCTPPRGHLPCSPSTSAAPPDPPSPPPRV